MTRPRVLVVDDKDTMVKLLARILSSEFDVTTAGDGTRALGLIGSQPFDVVISSPAGPPNASTCARRPATSKPRSPARTGSRT